MKKVLHYRIAVFTVGFLFAASAGGGESRWDFESEADLKLWVPNSHLGDVRADDGVVEAEGIGSDPFFLCRTMSVEAKPCQYVVLRLKASRAGIAELFWSGSLEGQYGGLTEAKKVRFAVEGGDEWQEIALFPFWHTEGTIRQLRLDLYEGADFAIDWIDVRRWGREHAPSNICIWGLDPDGDDWQIHPGAPERFAPPVAIDTRDKTWVTVRLASDRDGVAAVLWACADRSGLQSEEFSVRGDGTARFYDVHMAGLPTWQGRIVAFGIRLPAEANARIEQVQIGTEPLGPGRLEVGYLGFENGVNRAGRPCRLLAQVVNRGGRGHGFRGVHLTVAPGLTVVSEPADLSHEGIEHGDFATFVWEVKADEPGAYAVRLAFTGKGALPPDQTETLRFTEPPAVGNAAYVPEPRLVDTEIDVCAYYFPGWESAGKWDCVRRVAPMRKPVLAYYDESNPECVDWQIKWAVENGISCFLVDWYWVQGRRHLTHWFEAYRRAKHRDLLKVAIMWANHNPSGTHSAEDWLDVTRHWIDHYFSLTSYYRIAGKPAVFIWDPKAIRTDLGGTVAVRRVFDQSQEMVRAAGFEGMTLIALGYDFSPDHIRALEEEGYTGVTTYHEWGSALDGNVMRKLFEYEDVVDASPAAWRRKNDAAGRLTYYPLVDTGWDSRPWHGNKAMVIQGRTPQLFGRLLRQARSFCRENGKDIVILGPVNEWGEGSYIEPCTEFGFEMIEAVRRTFAEGAVSDWPVNVAPSDVGLGPYDFQPQPAVTIWTFDDGPQGWQPMMNVDRFRCEEGALRFRTITSDSAVIVHLGNVRASSFGKIVIRMQLAGDIPDHTTAQLFWSQGGAAITEASSARFVVVDRGRVHTYRIDLATHPRWSGRITTLRFDPCSSRDVDVVIDDIRLVR